MPKSHYNLKHMGGGEKSAPQFIGAATLFTQHIFELQKPRPVCEDIQNLINFTIIVIIRLFLCTEQIF